MRANCPANEYHRLGWANRDGVLGRKKVCQTWNGISEFELRVAYNSRRALEIGGDLDGALEW